MPKIFTIDGYNVYFWTNESNPLEPIHIHISKKPHENATKIWLLSDGSCEIANNNDNIPNHTLKDIIEVIEYSHEIVEKDWIKVFGKIYYKDKNINISDRSSDNKGLRR